MDFGVPIFGERLLEYDTRIKIDIRPRPASKDIMMVDNFTRHYLNLINTIEEQTPGSIASFYLLIEPRMKQEDKLYPTHAEHIAHYVARALHLLVPYTDTKEAEFRSRSDVLQDRKYEEFCYGTQKPTLKMVKAGVMTIDPETILSWTHMEYIFNEYFYLIKNPVINCKQQEFDILSRCTSLELLLLGSMNNTQLRLFNQVSATKLCLLFAVVTGTIIEPRYDPTAIDLPVLQSFRPEVNPLNLLKIGISYTNWQRVTNTLDETVNSGPGGYLIIVKPELAGFRHIYSKLVEFNAKASEYNTIPDDIIGVVDSLGLNRSVYSDNPLFAADSYVSEAIYRVPYYMAKTAGYLVPPLQFPVKPKTEVELNYHTYYWSTNPLEAELISLLHNDQEVISFYTPYYDEADNGYFNRGLYSKLLNTTDKIRMGISIYRSSYPVGWDVSYDNISCNNDNVEDPIMGGTRGANKQETVVAELEDDPHVLYYLSVHSRRRCFRLSELTTSFTDAGLGPEFLDPDWKQPTVNEDGNEVVVIDPILGYPLSRTFHRLAIMDLRRNLKNVVRDGSIKDYRDNILKELTPQAVANFKALLDAINIVIRSQNRGNIELTTQRNFVLSKEAWRNDLLIYFSWLFLFGNWLRFWKGPGTPYTTVWKEHNEGSASYEVRDHNVIIELDVRTIMLQIMETKSVELLAYIRGLPFYYRDWRTSEVTLPDKDSVRNLLKAHLIEEVIDLVQLTDFCMAQASDLLCGSALVYLQHVMFVPVDRINDLLIYVMRLLRGMEFVAIEQGKALAMKKTGLHRGYVLTAVEQHSQILDDGQLATQPPLDLSHAKASGHLPEGLNELLDEDDDDDQRLEDDSEDEGTNSDDEGTDSDDEEDITDDTIIQKRDDIIAELDEAWGDQRRELQDELDNIGKSIDTLIMDGNTVVDDEQEFYNILPLPVIDEEVTMLAMSIDAKKTLIRDMVQARSSREQLNVVIVEMCILRQRVLYLENIKSIIHGPINIHYQYNTFSAAEKAIHIQISIISDMSVERVAGLFDSPSIRFLKVLTVKMIYRYRLIADFLRSLTWEAASLDPGPFRLTGEARVRTLSKINVMLELLNSYYELEKTGVLIMTEPGVDDLLQHYVAQIYTAENVVRATADREWKPEKFSHLARLRELRDVIDIHTQPENMGASIENLLTSHMLRAPEAPEGVFNANREERGQLLHLSYAYVDVYGSTSAQYNQLNIDNMTPVFQYVEAETLLEDSKQTRRRDVTDRWERRLAMWEWKIYDKEAFVQQQRLHIASSIVEHVNDVPRPAPVMGPFGPIVLGDNGNNGNNEPTDKEMALNEFISVYSEELDIGISNVNIEERDNRWSDINMQLINTYAPPYIRKLSTYMLGMLRSISRAEELRVNPPQ